MATKAYKVEVKGVKRHDRSGFTDDEFYMIVADSFEEAGKMAGSISTTGRVAAILHYGEVVGNNGFPIIKALDRWV